jgi:hypothetical protein
MASYNIANLEREWCSYYEPDEDDPRRSLDDEDHFCDVAYWLAKALGHHNASFSGIQQSYYDDD